MLGEDPAALAEVFSHLDWAKEDPLAPIRTIPLKKEELYGAAKLLVVRDANAGLRLLDYAVAGSDNIELQLAAALLRLKVAKVKRNESLAKSARSELIAKANADPVAQLTVIAALAGQGESETIVQICGDARNARLAWPCAEADSVDLERYLDAIAALPVLGFKDFGRLAKLDSQRVLRGLQCNQSFRPDSARVLLPSRAGYRRQYEVTLYYRLSIGAPRPIAQCLLEHASIACVQLIESRAECPIPYVIAEYAKVLDLEEQEALIDSVISKKNELYGLLNRRQNEVKGVLFHLHLIVAELLVDKSPRKKLWLPSYHVRRSLGFYDSAASVSRFRDLLTSRLAESVCADDPEAMCKARCKNRDFPSCVADCTTDTKALKSMCEEPEKQ